MPYSFKLNNNMSPIFKGAVCVVVKRYRLEWKNECIVPWQNLFARFSSIKEGTNNKRN